MLVEAKWNSTTAVINILFYVYGLGLYEFSATLNAIVYRQLNKKFALKVYFLLNKPNVIKIFLA